VHQFGFIYKIVQGCRSTKHKKEVESVYCTVRTDSLNIIHIKFDVILIVHLH